MQQKPTRFFLRQSRALLTCAAIAALSACTVTPRHPAPVEDRSVGGSVKPTPVTVATPGVVASAPADSKPPAGAENAGKPGYYTVKPGDTLIRIALDNGQNWRDLVKWNSLDKPNLIEAGQVLRVAPPGVDPTVAATRPITSAKIETRPLDNKAGGVVPPVAASSPNTTVAAAAVARDSDDEPAWGWPVASAVTAGFDDQRNKGLDFNGKAGEAVLAAADGRVMYAGSGLRGYGNMVIIKHNNTYLTAYAHNQTLLVKEDQVVRKGQKIAEMGSSDADQVMLHFEVRKQGKPIDPAKLLPAR